METVLATWIIGTLLLAALYGLHRLGVYLERRGWMQYLHTPTAGGSAYNPLQELVQPQIRHVVEVGEQRQAEDDEGAPPVPSRAAVNRRAPDDAAG
jgi:hypothetical protein